ncbi:hypothetical protein B9479_002643 [Cryptococcus floricola]|uniref:THO complex subunit 2 n=1 Tax=Cryptococcus floricola TaxID=2591691 RepID=A0A5D3B0R2_9TREE|nr:hypothetical protein B9479_002643 [Cryptococcus floricola]
MPPKRGGRKARPSQPPPPPPPSLLPLLPDDLSKQLQESVSQWDDSGTDSLHTIISSLLEAIVNTPSALSAVPLLHTFVFLLKSEVDEKELTGVFEGVLDELDDAKKENFCESLVDAIEVLEDERETLAEGQTKQEGEDESRNINVLRYLLESNSLPAHIPNLLLAPDRLLSLNLHPMPRNPKALQSGLVKKNTSFFFKQRKFNLLRECSEGFSGLIVVLTSPDTLSDPADESDIDRHERAERVWGKIMRLIGYFNLSPPRVLDIILEVASCHVAYHWRFFLELLRCSPWGSAAVDNAKGKGKEREPSLDWKEEEVKGIENVMSEDGDRVLSQVLGFKFGYFRRNDAGDTPSGVVFVAALLVKHGFVTLADLLPFLAPDDSEMETARQTWASSLASRSGPSNALTSTILDDDEPSSNGGSSKMDDGKKANSKPPPEQRMQLCHALLAIGDKASAEYLLARWPWIAQKHTGVADLIMKIVDEAVDPIYQQICGKKDDLDYNAVAPVALEQTQLKKTNLLTLFFPVPPETATKRFEFFYPDWSEALETWTNEQEIHEKGLRWMGLIRGLGGRNARLMVKLCRIGVATFERQRQNKQTAIDSLEVEPPAHELIDLLAPTTDELQPWLDIIRILLLPALSCSSASAAFDVELWDLLKLFPYTARYSLYGEWRDSTCSANGRNPCLAATNAAAQTTKEVQKALRRVTSTTSTGPSAASQSERHSARALAKQSHGNPVFVWTTAVTQVKAYPNIGEAIVDAGRYMAQLSFDVATFVMLDTLSDDRAMRLNEMGTGVALWLERLSKFVGDFNRRYANMDLYPVLQYIINRLMRGHSGDLIILEKLMSSMSGLEPVPNDGVSEAQLQAYGGGRELIREAFAATRINVAPPPEPGVPGAPGGDGVQRAGPVEKVKNVKKSLPRLVNALRNQGLAMPIWIALAQTRQAVVDKLADTPMKAMNLVQDTCHNAFIQFGDFLVDNLTSNEHVNLTPDLQQLYEDFGLEYGMAFQILRPRLNAGIEKSRQEEKAAVQARLDAARKAMNGKDAEQSATASASGATSPSKAEDSPLAPGSPVPSTPPMVSTPAPEGDDVVMGDGENIVSAGTVPVPKAGSKAKAWWPSALTSTMHQTRQLLPKDANDVMSAPFFVIFWHLTTSDISYSSKSYDTAIKAIQRHISTVSSWRINTNIPGAKTKIHEQQDELARLRSRVEVLKKESVTHGNFVNQTMKRRLKLESGKWFGKSIVDKSLQRILALQLHQYCFYPRAILSPCDAVFVAKFIRLAHDLGTPGFSTLFVYNNIFNDNLAACIFSCTDSEARNLGRCLALILEDLDKWHQSEEVYVKEALGITQSASGEEEESKRLPGMLFRSKSGEEMKQMTWQEFRNLYAKFHNALTRTLISCWSEAEFMHNKNAIIVALQVIKFFPLMESNGELVEAAVKKLQAGEVGEIPSDLKMMCTSFLSGLSKRQTIRPFVPPSAFHRSAPAAQPLAARLSKSSLQAPSTPSRSLLANEIGSTASSAPGTPVPPAPSVPSGPASSATPVVDQAALRQKVEESRRHTEELRARAALEERKIASSSPANHPIPNRPNLQNRMGSGAHNASLNAPTGPAARTPLSHPLSRANTPSSTMGPPDSQSEEAIRAQRAKRFQRPPPPPPSQAASATASPVPAGTDLKSAADLTLGKGVENENNTPGTPSPPADGSATRGGTPTPPSRASPSATSRNRRDGSLESRASERSRRSGKRDSQREKYRDASRDKERDRNAHREDGQDKTTEAIESERRRHEEDLRRARSDDPRSGDRDESSRRHSRRDDEKRKDGRDKTERRGESRRVSKYREDESGKRKREDEYLASSRKPDHETSSSSGRRGRDKYDDRDSRRDYSGREGDRDSRDRRSSRRDDKHDSHRSSRNRGDRQDASDGRHRDGRGHSPANEAEPASQPRRASSPKPSGAPSDGGPAERGPHSLPARPTTTSAEGGALHSPASQGVPNLSARLGGMRSPSPHMKNNSVPPASQGKTSDSGPAQFRGNNLGNGNRANHGGGGWGTTSDNGWGTRGTKKDEPRNEERRELGGQQQHGRESRVEEPREETRKEQVTQEESKKEGSGADRKRALEGGAREDSPGAAKRPKIDRNKNRPARNDGNAASRMLASGGVMKK